MSDKKIWEKNPKNVNIPFFSTKNVNFFPVIKQSIPKISTAYSVIVPSMRWEAIAAEISDGWKTGLRIAAAVCFPMRGAVILT